MVGWLSGCSADVVDLSFKVDILFFFPVFCSDLCLVDCFVFCLCGRWLVGSVVAPLVLLTSLPKLEERTAC